MSDVYQLPGGSEGAQPDGLGSHQKHLSHTQIENTLPHTLPAETHAGGAGGGGRGVLLVCEGLLAIKKPTK